MHIMFFFNESLRKEWLICFYYFDNIPNIDYFMIPPPPSCISMSVHSDLSLNTIWYQGIHNGVISPFCIEINRLLNFEQNHLLLWIVKTNQWCDKLEQKISILVTNNIMSVTALAPPIPLLPGPICWLPDQPIWPKMLACQ